MTSSCEVRRAVYRLGLGASALKLLLFPAAYSTDLEVHRFWKALTWSKPLSEWYTDTTSMWTLDYPPLFAYFELFLASIARLVHPQILDVNVRDYNVPEALQFMRVSVLVTDALLIASTCRLVSAVSTTREGVETERAGNVVDKPGRDVGTVSDPAEAATEGLFGWDHAVTSAALVLFNPGLFLVDNVHFQYNGFVLAVLMFSISFFIEGRHSAGAAMFSVAVNLKHTFLPIAPVMATYLLISVHDEISRAGFLSGMRMVCSIAGGVVIVVSIAWLPLYVSGGVAAIRACFGRLFPLGRGLFHAYWAPNFWTLFATTDKALSRLGYSVRTVDVSPFSGRIGGLRPFSCLPNPTPLICACLVMLSIVPALLGVAYAGDARKPKRSKDIRQLERGLMLPRAVAYSALCAFVFGWHVHEKMILLATVPMGAALFSESGWRKREALLAYCLVSLGGHLALHPLITSPGESTYKVLHYWAYAIFLLATVWFEISASSTLCDGEIPESGSLLRRIWSRVSRFSGRRLGLPSTFVVLYTLGALAVEMYAGAGGIHRFLFGTERLQFLPLLITSAFGAFGVISALITFAGSFVPG